MIISPNRPYTREFMLKILWNIDREQRTVTVTKLIEGQTGWSAMSASFSPVSADRVCVCGNGNPTPYGHITEASMYLSAPATITTRHTCLSIRFRVSFTGKPLVAGTCVPQSHTWATHSDIIYVGCREGELLTFTVKPPDPPKIAASPAKEKESKGRKADKEKEKEQKERDENEDVKAKEPEWRCLIVLDDPGGPVTHMCARDGHLVVVGDGGHMRWVTVPKEPVEKKKKEGGKKSRKRRKKGKREGKDDKAKADDSQDVRSDDSSLEKEALVVCELSLNVPEVRSMEYGAPNGLIATVRVNQQILEPQLSASSTDLLPTLTSMKRGAEIEWESEHREAPSWRSDVSGSRFSLLDYKGAKFMVTAGKDTTVRVWTSDRGKEVSCTYLKAAQTCMLASQKNSYICTFYLVLVTRGEDGAIQIRTQVFDFRQAQ
ncbi:hypothetical protein R1sor_011625 [Riccia sorocarpa]|uniref:Cilia- and flagella-associated protein 43 n=1 Tax=Riccia sorocarpa TaxID=122646 RepID=A0ABD3I7J9_9MARC